MLKHNGGRSVSLINEGGKWEFQATGVVQNYEDLEQYKDKKATNRFNLETLDMYLKSNMILGLKFLHQLKYKA